MATYQTVIAEKQLALADRTGLPTVPQLAAIMAADTKDDILRILARY